MINFPATIMKDFKKNAQFPGFRKGTIPPFMLPKVKQFVILDCLEKTLSEAVKDEVFRSLLNALYFHSRRTRNIPLAPKSSPDFVAASCLIPFLTVAGPDPRQR
jgi:FKBP-type peptidyl-prolyl cis-trans isomerase (trigger factor)